MASSPIDFNLRCSVSKRKPIARAVFEMFPLCSRSAFVKNAVSNSRSASLSGFGVSGMTLMMFSDKVFAYFENASYRFGLSADL